jgi:hypothetical protein
MKLQSAIKIIFASTLAACCVVQADAQTVVTELSGTVDSLQGYGFANNAIGQLVTLDFSYDASAQTSSFTNGIFTLSAPITSAHTVSGAFGSGINLERDGPGTGTVATTIDTNTNTGTATAVTSADAPHSGFTGSVFGFSFLSDGFTGTLELVRNAFTNGISNPGKSGAAFLSNVNVVAAGQAPEIDPASALSALTLLMGGLAVIRGKKFAEVPTA